MQTISSTDARNNFSRAIMMAQREPLFIQKQGQDVAVLISAQDYARIRQQKVEKFLQLAKEIGEEAQKSGLTDAELASILRE